MRKVFYIISLLLIGWSCSNEADNLKVSKPEIEKSAVTFDAAGGTGTIVIKDNKSISATKTTAEWCKIEVNNNIATVTVPVNEDLSGRSALVTLTVEGVELTVPVTQAGAFLAMDNEPIRFQTTGGEKRIPFKSSFELDIETNADWLQYKIENGELVFIALKNETNIPRGTKVKVTSGIHTKEFVVNQFSYANLIGNWTMHYEDDEGNALTRLAEIIENEVNKSFILQNVPLGAGIQLLYDDESGNLTIVSGQFLGRINPYYVFLTLYSPSTGYLTWSQTVQYEAALAFDQNGLPYFEFKDNASWAGNIVEGYLSYAFSSETPSSASMVGTFNHVMDIQLKKE